MCSVEYILMDQEERKRLRLVFVPVSFQCRSGLVTDMRLILCWRRLCFVDDYCHQIHDKPCDLGSSVLNHALFSIGV